MSVYGFVVAESDRSNEELTEAENKSWQRISGFLFIKTLRI
jgi:hypothetical protein